VGQLGFRSQKPFYQSQFLRLSICAFALQAIFQRRRLTLNGMVAA
jgi:hypothetical protein